MNVSSQLKQTPLAALHRELGGRLVPFAGYEMPVQYPTGILKEHRHTREAAGLFDVSHMGQVRLTGENAAAALERLVPVDVVGLGTGRQRYALFTNERGGILDDLMITHAGDHLFVVVNGACKEQDLALLQRHLGRHLGDGGAVEPLTDQALIALQGPLAAAVMARLAPRSSELVFMTAATLELDGAACLVTRSGYTGEDGFEISVPAERAEALARRLLAEDEVAPIGLGARDTLRLEAGLCLYGHDIDAETTPVAAGLIWALSMARRRDGARPGGYPGADVVRRQIEAGPPRRLVGLRPDGRVPAREATPITDAAGAPIGAVTSGLYGPSVEGPVAMGYVAAEHAAAGTEVALVVRGTPRPARVTALPFVPHRYHKI